MPKTREKNLERLADELRVAEAYVTEAEAALADPKKDQAAVRRYLEASKAMVQEVRKRLEDLGGG